MDRRNLVEKVSTLSQAEKEFFMEEAIKEAIKQAGKRKFPLVLSSYWTAKSLDGGIICGKKPKMPRHTPKCLPFERPVVSWQVGV